MTITFKSDIFISTTKQPNLSEAVTLVQLIQLVPKVKSSKIGNQERKTVDIMRDYLLKRYEEAMKKLRKYDLTTLPDEVKEVLKNTTDLETKVKMLEEIAKSI